MEPAGGIESCEEKGPKVRDCLGSRGEMGINGNRGENLEDSHHANETTVECPGFHSLCLNPGGYPSNRETKSKTRSKIACTMNAEITIIPATPAATVFKEGYVAIFPARTRTKINNLQ
jgi:hypothetical protein